jgi:hypothetical protein
LAKNAFSEHLWKNFIEDENVLQDVSYKMPLKNLGFFQIFSSEKHGKDFIVQDISQASWKNLHGTKNVSFNVFYQMPLKKFFIIRHFFRKSRKNYKT